MSGTRYREIGDRAVISVRALPERRDMTGLPITQKVYGIYRGEERFSR